MLRYLAFLALPLCACASTVPPAAPPHVVSAPVDESTTSLTKETKCNSEGVCFTSLIPKVISVEAEGHQTVQVMLCSSELDCMQKLTGFCSNGYRGGQLVHSGKNKDVVEGSIFLCITDEQVAARKAQEAEWKEEIARQTALRDAAIKAAEEEAQKKTTPKHKK